MRVGRRYHVKASAAVFFVTFLGVLMQCTLVLDSGETLETRLRIAVGVPSAYFLLLTAISFQAIFAEATCRLLLSILLGYLAWPICFVVLTMTSVPGIWRIACYFPKLADKYFDGYSHYLNVSSCEEDKVSLQSDWRVLAVWAGSALIFGMVNVHLSTAKAARREILSDRNQYDFREQIELQRQIDGFDHDDSHIYSLGSRHPGSNL